MIPHATFSFLEETKKFICPVPSSSTAVLPAAASRPGCVNATGVSHPQCPIIQGLGQVCAVQYTIYDISYIEESVYCFSLPKHFPGMSTGDQLGNNLHHSHRVDTLGKQRTDNIITEKLFSDRQKTNS